MITIENLKHFVGVVENQGVLRAAEKLFISASSITRSIQQIESDLGKPLFDRVGRHLTLNHDGSRFHERARDLLHGYALLLHEESTQPDLRGHYKIGASHFLGEHLLSDLMAKFTQKFKRATVEICSLDSYVLMKKLHGGDLDLGFSFSPKASEPIETRKFAEGQLLLCAGKRHPLHEHHFGEVKKRLSDYPAIIHRPSDSIERCDNHPMFEKHRITPRVQVYWDSDYFALGLLANTEHWSMLPDIVIESHPEIAAFRHPKDWKAPYEIDVLWNRRKAVGELRDAILDLLRDNPDESDQTCQRANRHRAGRYR